MKLPNEAAAQVISVLNRSTIRLLVHPGVGLVDGGIPMNIPLDLVPLPLRMPNTMLTVTMEAGTITEVRAQDTGT